MDDVDASAAASTAALRKTPEIVCTALEGDWNDDRPNILMHPPCGCPRCAPPEVVEDERQWLVASGRQDRLRVEPAILGETGRSVL